MNFHRLARHGVVAVLTSSLLAVLVGACSSNSNEVCGVNEVKNGVCDEGPTCPSGTVWLNVTSPADACPDTYLCCVPTTLGSAAGSAPGSGAGSAAGSGSH